ncbi:hypothetical protein [Actinopolyspora halophila]|uniref:hypothetical protein n=1 Tax=Actinopolyspora halophila TaxID=1850 RepID=UPI0003706877|nr:hypothetical protein [Actinopolyspora halophila]
MALLHGWVSTSDWPINWATESTLALAFGTGCGLVLLGLRKRLAPRRSGNAEAPHER